MHNSGRGMYAQGWGILDVCSEWSCEMEMCTQGWRVTGLHTRVGFVQEGLKRNESALTEVVETAIYTQGGCLHPGCFSL